MRFSKLVFTAAAVLVWIVGRPHTLPLSTTPNHHPEAEKALESYQTSLRLNPENEDLEEKIARLRR